MDPLQPTPPDAPLRLGDVLLERELGSGGMGRVLGGRHLGSGAPVAVKVLNDAGLRTPAVRLAFGNEVRAVAALNHPAIVPILDYGQLPEGVAGHPLALTPESPFLAMPMAAGGTSWGLRGRMSWPSLRWLAEALLDALGHAHARGVLHRDLKPSNVLLRDARDLAAGIWLADFGLVSLDKRRFPDAQSLQGGGTPGYHSPEQVTPGRWPEGPWTDLFALGRTLAKLSDGGQVAGAPEGLGGWLGWLCAPEPERRPRFAAQARDALRALDGRAPKRRWKEEPKRSSLEPAMGLSVLSLRVPRFVGRGPERGALWGALEQVCARRSPALALIEGPRGVGRSRVAKWIAEQAHARGLARTASLRLRAGPVVLDPLADVVQQVLGLRRLHPGPQRWVLDQALRPFGWSAGELERLIELLEPPEVRGLAVRVSSPRGRSGLLRRAILDLSRACPLVLVLDDAHLDGDALAFARSIADGAGGEGAALLLVVTATSEALRVPGWAQDGLRELADTSALRLRLGPLSEAEHRGLVADMLGGRVAPVEEIVRRSMGDPGFAVQLVHRYAAREGAAREPADAALPEAIQDLFTEQALRALGGLAHDGRRAVFLAALLGPEVEWEEWRACCAAAGLVAQTEVFEPLGRAGLMRDSALGPRFVTSALRACVAGLAEDEGEASGLHRACAEGLREALFARRARHHLAAGQLAEAVGPLSRAMQRASEEGRDVAHRAQLMALWEQLVAALDRAEPEAREGAWTEDDRVRGELAVVDTLHALGRRDAHLARAASLRGLRIRDEDLRLDWVLAQAYALWMQGEVERYLALLEEAEGWATGEHHARVRSAQVIALRMLGRHGEAATLARQVLAFFGDADTVYALEPLRQLSNHLSAQGELAASLAAVRELRRRALKLGHPYYIGISWNIEGGVHEALGDAQSADPAYQRSIQLLDAVGSWRRLVPRLNYGALLVGQGRYGEARQILERVGHHAAALSDPIEVGMIIVWLSRALAGLGAWGAVREDWADIDLRCARVNPKDTLPTLRACAELAEQAGAWCAGMYWTLTARAAELAGDEALAATARGRGFAEGSISRASEGEGSRHEPTRPATQVVEGPGEG